MASNDFEINLLANTNQAVKSIQGLAKTAVAVGASLVAAFTFGKGIKEVVSAAIEAESSLNSMVASLKLAGDFSEEASKGFQDLADTISKNTTLDDDYVLSLVAVAKNLGLTNKQTEKTVQASADLAAAALGVDARTATEALSKAYEGNGQQIGRLIPQLRGLTEEQLRAGFATDFVANRFAGAANNAAQTFGGSLTQLQNVFGNVIEAIGGLITQNPFLIDSIKLVSTFFVELKDNIQGNQSTIIKFTNVALAGLIKGIGIVVEAFGLLIGNIGKISKLFANLSVAIFKVADAIGVYKILGKVFDGIAVAVATATLRLLELVRLVSGLGITKNIFGSIGISLDGLDDKIKDTQKSVIKFTESFNGEETLRKADIAKIKFFDSVAANAEVASESVKAISGNIVNFADKAIEANKRVTKDSKIAAENLKNQAKSVKEFTNDQLKQIGENPVKFLIDFVSGKFDGTNLIKGFQTAGIGALGAATKGAEGATELIAKGLGEAGAAFAGLPIAGPLTEVVKLLAQGPDKVRETIQSFIRAIPTVIENIITAIPVLIQTIAEEMPGLVEKINSLIPRLLPSLITTFAKLVPIVIASLAAQTPLIVTSFVSEFIKQTPAIAQALIDAVKGLIPGGSTLSKLPGGSQGGGGGGFLGSVLDFLNPFAEGGIVPQGFPNDTFPSALSSGEAVIPNNVVDKLESFLNGGGQNQNVTINLQVGEQQLANVILNLNRRGFRTSA